MVRTRNRPRRKNVAPAAIHYTSAINEQKRTQLCVYARCEYSTRTVGPIWSHEPAAVRRALATLSQQCDCPARRHQAREYSGKRILRGTGG